MSLWPSKYLNIPKTPLFSKLEFLNGKYLIRLGKILILFQYHLCQLSNYHGATLKLILGYFTRSNNGISKSILK